MAWGTFVSKTKNPEENVSGLVSQIHDLEKTVTDLEARLSELENK